MKRARKRYTRKELKILRENYKDLSYRELGELLGRTEASVRTKVSDAGFELKRENYWSEAEVEWLIESYHRSKNTQNLNLSLLSQKLGKLKSNVCRKARDLGLTDRHRTLTEEQKHMLGERSQEWHKNNEHPRGMLGKTHSDEVKKMFSLTRRGRKLNLTSEGRQALSANARKNIKKLMSSGNMYSRTKSGKREDLNNTFFRSSWEANYARYLNYQNIRWEFEPKEFIFKEEVRGTKTYIPDFYLPVTREWVEVKGWLDAKSKSKLLKFKKYYPEYFKKLRLVVNKLQGSEQTWAFKNGLCHVELYTNIVKQFSHKIQNWE